VAPLTVFACMVGLLLLFGAANHIGKMMGQRRGGGPSRREPMADYRPLIAKVVTGLEKSTGEARRAAYDRARAALLAQLRAVKPALSEPDITRERLALEEAIRLVEAEAARRSRGDPPRDYQPIRTTNLPVDRGSDWRSYWRSDWQRYLATGRKAGWIAGGLTFIGAYIYCVATYGFLLGMGLGWLPSGILAAIVGVISVFLWGPLLVVGFFFALYFADYHSR
jgi:hypothetical protein